MSITVYVVKRALGDTGTLALKKNALKNIYPENKFAFPSAALPLRARRWMKYS